MFLTAALLLIPAGVVARADALDDARAQGAIGERFDGFAAVRDPGASPDIRKLVEDINAKRRKLYNDVSTKEGTTIDAVGRIYARQIVGIVPAGTWILNENGQWVRK
ncbi:MAG: YdbL family protein [Alphaproteobacteria bacterium]|nr:YdbL family protein [Alphaproteobacteria bacterium]